jgi:hypothetical protein
MGLFPRKLDGKRIEIAEDNVGFMILHEMTHALDDAINDYAYDWEDSIDLGAAKATRNAQSYAFLGVWAVLADWGYTLQRYNVEGDKPENADYNRRKGFIQKYKEITKRTLRAERFY